MFPQLLVLSMGDRHVLGVSHTDVPPPPPVRFFPPRRDSAFSRWWGWWCLPQEEACLVPSMVCAHIITVFCVGVFIFLLTPEVYK